MPHPNDCLKSCKLGHWPLSSFGSTLWHNNFRKNDIFFLEVLDGYLIILLTIVLKKSMVLDLFFFFYFEWSCQFLHYCLSIQNRKPVIFRSVYKYSNVEIKTTKGIKNSFPKKPYWIMLLLFTTGHFWDFHHRVNSSEKD